jgi:hypothetical protein
MNERLHVLFANKVIYLVNYYEYKQLYHPNLNMYNNTLFPLLKHPMVFPPFLRCEVTYESLYVINIVVLFPWGKRYTFVFRLIHVNT